MLTTSTCSLLFALTLLGTGGTVVHEGMLPGTGTGQLQDFELAQFDTQGGARVLDSVTLELFTSVIGGGTTTSSGVPTTFSATLTADLLLADVTLIATEAFIGGSMPNNGPIFSFTLFDTDEGSAVLTSAPELAPWIGTGTITLTSFTNLVLTEEPAATIFFGAGGGSDYTVTYAYSDAVASYCTAGSSASGCQAVLSASGAPSASAVSGFVVSAATVEGDRNGQFYFGTSGRSAVPWGNGTSYRCVLPPTRRAGLLAGTGTPGACDGTFAQDLTARWQSHPASNPGAGSTVQLQLWYRDAQNTSNRTTSFSDALEFCVTP